MVKKSVARGGRSKRIEKRLAKPIIDPCPPGQLGGAYKPLNEQDILQIYNTAIKLGAKDEGAPGIRSGDYYCYFRDLDGNKICAFSKIDN